MVIGLMGYFEEAVDLAIEKEELELAKSYANKPNDEKQKKLWLKIVKYLFDK